MSHRDKTAIRPFHVEFPEAELTELRRHINATRWPERETVTDHSNALPQDEPHRAPHEKSADEMVSGDPHPPSGLTRRHVVSLVGATGLGMALARAGSIPRIAEAAPTAESVGDIINIIVTAEAMAVTLLGAAIQGAAGYTNPDGSKGLAALNVSILKAAQSAEQAHYAYLTRIGAKPAMLEFNIPDPKIGTDTTTLFKTIEMLEMAFISTYVAAAREFAGRREADLVMLAVQTGAVEAEHLVLARLALGETPPNNVAFEKAGFTNVGEAAATLKRLGFFGGSGTLLKYRDFASIVDNTGMSQLTPWER